MTGRPRPAFAPDRRRVGQSRCRPGWWPDDIEYLDACELAGCEEAAVNYVATIRVEPVRRQPSRIVRPRCARHTYPSDTVVDRRS